MSYDLTSATTLTETINKNLPRKPWIFRKFFGTKFYDTTQIAIDIVKGTKKLAPFRREGEESSVKNSIQVETKLFGPNQISMKNLTKAFDEKKRAPGVQFSSAYGVKTVEGRIKFKLTQEQIDLTNLIYGTIEKMCAEAIFDGVVNNYDAKGNIIESFNMGIPDDHIIALTGDDRWNQNGAKILDNIDTYCDLVEDDSALPATDVILGANAKKSLLSNELVLKQLSVNKSQFALIDPIKKDVGGKFIGYTSTGVRLWQCTETYEDSEGHKQNYVKDDYIAVLSDQFDASVHFGLIEDLKAGAFEGEIFSKVWDEEDPSGTWLKCASAPLAYVSRSDALVVVKVQ